MSYSYTNYNTVHSDLKTAITDKGFSYVHSEKWFNLEYGVFPDALKGNSFTIKFLSSGDTDIGDSNYTELFIELEFCLDTFRDKYLKKIGSIQEALSDFHAKAQSRSEILVHQTDDYFKFNTTYLQDKVICSFTIPVVHRVRLLEEPDTVADGAKWWYKPDPNWTEGDTLTAWENSGSEKNVSLLDKNNVAFTNPVIGTQTSLGGYKCVSFDGDDALEFRHNTTGSTDIDLTDGANGMTAFICYIPVRNMDINGTTLISRAFDSLTDTYQFRLGNRNSAYQSNNLNNQNQWISGGINVVESPEADIVGYMQQTVHPNINMYRWKGGNKFRKWYCDGTIKDFNVGLVTDSQCYNHGAGVVTNVGKPMTSNAQVGTTGYRTQIAEIVWYDKHLDYKNVNKIGNYLATKYGTNWKDLVEANDTEEIV